MRVTPATEKRLLDIVILHCHFERGGVTQVVENHIRALAAHPDVGRILLVSGSRQSGLSEATRSGATTIEVGDFDYDRDDLAAGSALDRSADIATRLESELRAAGVRPDAAVLHWHNHSLGKNTAAPAVIRRLAAGGWRLLLQIHDFAEDNRPENYQRLISATSAKSRDDLDRFLYPVAPQIRYATLTGGDARVLVGLGVPDSQVHCLPNSVVLPPMEQTNREAVLATVRRVIGLPDGARWSLYPVRGIRRKNVGEFLLVSRWLPEKCFAALTLQPATEIENRSYRRWQRLAAEVAPRAIFDAGHHPEISFSDNLVASDFILSTSVAEGFGMAFLEPWLAGRGVIARRLPGVTDDFESAGMRLSSFYFNIPIPGKPQWLSECHQEIDQAQQAAWSSVPPPFRPRLGEDISGADETIDFARLTPARQMEVLRHAAASQSFDAALRELSEPLIQQLHRPPSDDVIRHNAGVVGNRYSPEVQGVHLREIYQQLLSAPIDRDPSVPQRAGDAVHLVSRARPFYPCRTESDGIPS